MAQKKREDKRKKRRFRKSKPTHIEVVRCLVDIQMQALQQFIGYKDQKEQPCIRQEANIKDDNSTGHKYKEERKLYKDYYRKGVNRDRLNEHHEDYRRQHRSRSKEHQLYKHKRHQISPREEFPYKKHCRSRSKERRNCGRSQSKEKRKHSTSRSNLKSKNSHRRSRHNRSCSADISEETPNYRNRSCKKRSRSRSPDSSTKRKIHNSRKYERISKSPLKALPKEIPTHRQKHFRNRDNNAYHSGKKSSCEEKYYERQSKSPKRGHLSQSIERDTTKTAYYEYQSFKQNRSTTQSSRSHW